MIERILKLGKVSHVEMLDDLNVWGTSIDCIQQLITSTHQRHSGVSLCSSAGGEAQRSCQCHEPAVGVPHRVNGVSLQVHVQACA